MSADLFRELRELERDYAGQPLIAQQVDLKAINDLRARLGMPRVDAKLHEIGVTAEEVKSQPKPEVKPDHTAARAIYDAYRKKVEELAIHQAYADRVARATGGGGMTPVRPLATMGTDGGPLLCDHCRKPILLEGGHYNNIGADLAWAQNPVEGWRSWILGGMVVEIQVNGTLRIYHGYPGPVSKYCCNVARRNDEQAQSRFKSEKSREKYELLRAFAADEFPDLSDKDRTRLVNEVLNTVYDYDPGIGINRPTPERNEPPA